jgi:hypothetical protein
MSTFCRYIVSIQDPRTAFQGFFEKSQVEDEIILRPGPRGDVNLSLILAAYPQAISSGFQACIADSMNEFPLAMMPGI